MAVNRPTDVKFKEQDVSNKLQLYGIYSAFAQGKVPSNKQIDIALNSALESSALKTPSGKLSEEGQKLVADLRQVIEQAKLLLLSKNQDNLLQEFIWETQRISAGDTKLPNAPVDKDTAKAHGNEALEGLRTLGTLIITNGQFRKLLSDAAILMRSMAGDAASKAAGTINPSEDQLAQIDHAADDNTWHETPDLSRERMKKEMNRIKPFGKKDVREAVGDGTTVAHPDSSRDLAGTAVLAAQDQRAGTASGVDVVNGAGAAAGSLKQTTDQKVSPETKNRTKEYSERTQAYLKEKMPKERREQTIWRLKKMVVEIQGHADYQQAIDTLLRLAEEYGGHAGAVANQSQGTVKGVRSDDSVRKAEANLKTLLERFANGTSSDDFFDALNQIYRDADADHELKDWFTSVNAYIRRCLKEPGYILQPISTDDFNVIYDHGKYLLRQKYRVHTDRLLDEVKFFGNQFDEDPQNKAFGQAVQTLLLDLGNDESGNATFKPHLLKDVATIIIPEFLENLHYIPIPRMEYSDPKVDLIIENLIVESDNLTPNVLEFSSDNYWKWGRRAFKNANKNSVMVAVSGVQMDLRDVSFYVHKKKGFPNISDQGLCDIFMGGEGFSFKLKMQTADQLDRQHFFQVTDAKVKVKNFNIKLKQSRHKLLFAIAKPIILRAMRPALQKVLEAVIKQKAHELDGIIHEINQEAKAAQKEAQDNPNPDNVKNIYQRHWDAANARWSSVRDAKRKAAESAVNQSKFNMAMTKQDSIFPNIALPSGISTKATEYKELAGKGERWESPVFTMGSAQESTNIPTAPKIVRKNLGKPAGFSNTSGIKNGYTNGANGVSSSYAAGQGFNPVNA